MKRIKHKDWNLLIADNIADDEASEYFELVNAENFTITKSLKDHHRSIVLRIGLRKKDAVLKIPVEKNNRPWIRFLTWFRKGEAFKNITGMLKLWDRGVKTTVPIMAAEKRTFGMVKQSWLIYEYLDGTTCLDHPEYFEGVVAKLGEIHSRGLLHGDPQIRNFIAKGDEIYVIDCNPKPTGYFGFARAYEFAYLGRSQPEIIDYFGKIKDWWLFKLARWYDLSERKLKRKKRKLKFIKK